jgi:membrane-associated PAP2 superfamily phosphatase
MESSFTNFMDRTFWPSIVILLAIFGFFEITNVDLWVQDHFYNVASHAWLVDAKAKLPHLLFYVGPKLLIWLFGIGVLALLLTPKQWRERLQFNHFERSDLWIVVGTLALAPLSIATFKATTNVHTPSEIRRYGGKVPYVKVCEAYPAGDHPKKRGRGFPAGHASGGFALLALAGIARTNRGRRIGIGIGLALGIWMGGYQILKGAHYLSHTLITAILCWTIFLALRRVRQKFALKCS